MEGLLRMARTLLSSRKTLLTTVGGTGGYVVYTNTKRYSHMIHNIKHGKILLPMDHDDYIPCYQPRPALEERLRYILGPEFTSQYYLVKGEVGSGKSRTIQEQVKRLIAEEGSHGNGAPIYVLTTEHKGFSDTLGEAVNFKFDEHVNFAFFIQYMMQISKFPSKDDRNKLNRVLYAIECAACKYMQTHGRPMVLVIDGAGYLTTHMPGTLQKLQEKAKLWADQNICKVVFICSEEKTEKILRENPSCWARAAEPVHVSDLSRQQALQHLDRPQLLNGKEITGPAINKENAETIYNLVGGRIHYLNIFKRDYLRGIPIQDTANALKAKEREKFVRIARVPQNWKAVEIACKSTNHMVYLSELVKATSAEIVDNLVEADIFKLVACDSGIWVKFESRLTENTVEEMYGKYNSKS